MDAAVEVVRALAEGFQLRVTSNTLPVDPARFVDAVVTAVMATWFAGAFD